MRHIRRLIPILFCLLLVLSCLLTGCSEGGDSEATTQTLKYNGDAEEASSEEYISETIDTVWGNYEVTTNEIDYTVGEELLDEDGYYTSVEDVATYIVEYGTLPDNFLTKKEARALGWNGGGLDDYADDCSIGGDYFNNREGLLPEVDGRSYYECDIDTMNASKRGAKRIIYSDDGQIYYTSDHYESFELIYGTDE